MVQLKLFEERKVAEGNGEKKPRLTLKAKKAAYNDMYDQIIAGWEPCDETNRLLEWLRIDIAQSEAKKNA